MFPVFIHVASFLISIRGFPDAREGWKIKLLEHKWKEEFMLIVASCMGIQGKMAGNSTICIRIHSQLILPEFIY